MRVNISPIGLKSIVEIKNRNKINYSTNPNSELKSDVFIKSVQPSFTGNTSFVESEELKRHFTTSIFTGNSEKMLEYYAKNPEVIEAVLWSPQELRTLEDRNIDNLFGFDKTGKYLDIYDTRSGGCIPFINRTLLSNLSGGETLSPLLSAIAQKNPDFFRKNM